MTRMIMYKNATGLWTEERMNMGKKKIGNAHILLSTARGAQIAKIALNSSLVLVWVGKHFNLLLPNEYAYSISAAFSCVLHIEIYVPAYLSF